MVKAIRQNRNVVYKNDKLKDIICDSELIEDSVNSLIKKSFAYSQLARTICNSLHKNFITKYSKLELKLLRYILARSRKFLWSTPI